MPLGLYNRRRFIGAVGSAILVGWISPTYAASKRRVMTVKGWMNADQLGNTLVHEHILVDFIGAAEVHPPRWDREAVIEAVLPFLEEARNAGCQSFVDCTPHYLGRDVALLRILSQKTGLNFITNTGYYGGSDQKFVPDHVHSETTREISERWIAEWKYGIDGTPIRPGFIKISVNDGPLSDISRKLIEAACLTHLRTGLTIASHTSSGVAAVGQMDVLRKFRIDPSAFIWVHAQEEKDNAMLANAAKEGAWISLDGLNTNNVPDYVQRIAYLREQKCLHRTLVSHDAGWYDPGKADDKQEIRGYTTLFSSLIPSLKENGFAEQELNQILRENPANAYSITVKRRKNEGKRR